jgi:hypothetical protein
MIPCALLSPYPLPTDISDWLEIAQRLAFRDHPWGRRIMAYHHAAENFFSAQERT